MNCTEPTLYILEDKFDPLKSIQNTAENRLSTAPITRPDGGSDITRSDSEQRRLQLLVKKRRYNKQADAIQYQTVTRSTQTKPRRHIDIVQHCMINET